MKFLVLGLLLMGMGLVSCGKEDPLDGKDQGVTQAIPDAGEEKPQADRVDFLRVAFSAVEFNFTEEQSAQYVVTGSSAEPKATFALQAMNLDEFPGSTFDPATGVFDWKPSIDFLTDFNPRRLNLQIRISTTNLPTVRSNDAYVPVVVSPGNKLPNVVSINFTGKNSVREGDSLEFDVQVKDVTGLDADGSRPTISIAFDGYESTGAADVGSIMKLKTMRTGEGSNPAQSVTDPGMWTFHMVADLTDQDVTDSSKELSFSVTAISRFKVLSPSKRSSLTVLTNLHDPVLTWSDPVVMKAGQKNSFTFMVFDPRGEGNVQFSMTTKCGRIHPNLKCGACTTVNDRTFGDVLYCPVTWDIPADYFDNDGADQVTLDMQVFSKSRVNKDNFQTPAIKYSRKISILKPDVAPVPPAPPAPAPTPAPTPTPSPSPAPLRGN